MSGDFNVCWNGKLLSSGHLDRVNPGSSEQRKIAEAILHWHKKDQFVFHTSGSTGTPKEINFTKDQLRASIALTQRTFELTHADTALLALPMKYVAGKMMLFRALEMEMDLVTVESKIDLTDHYKKSVSFAAFIPLQVEHLLSSEEGRAWLGGIRVVLVGGGPISRDIEASLNNFENDIYHTYGMTETLTHIAVRKLSQGGSPSFSPLSGISISKGEEDNLIIYARHLDVKVETNDLVEINDDKTFHLLGRIDNVINSAGLKIIPERLEGILRPLLQRELVIIGLPDDSFGEKVCLIIEGSEVDDQEWIDDALSQLPNNQRPKEIFYLSNFPRTESGKIMRKNLKSKIIG